MIVYSSLFRREFHLIAGADWDKLLLGSAASEALIPSVDFDYQPSTWVKLVSLPNAYSHDEALLLCQCDDDQWLAWIPEQGEVLLHTHQFCPL